MRSDGQQHGRQSYLSCSAHDVVRGAPRGGVDAPLLAEAPGTGKKRSALAS